MASRSRCGLTDNKVSYAGPAIAWRNGGFCQAGARGMFASLRGRLLLWATLRPIILPVGMFIKCQLRRCGVAANKAGRPSFLTAFETDRLRLRRREAQRRQRCFVAAVDLCNRYLEATTCSPPRITPAARPRRTAGNSDARWRCRQLEVLQKSYKLV